MAQKTPKYSLHKASGQAFVYLDRKPKYLGKYRSPKSWQKHHRIVGQWMLSRAEQDPDASADTEFLTVVQLCNVYMAFVTDFYPKDSQYNYRCMVN